MPNLPTSRFSLRKEQLQSLEWMLRTTITTSNVARSFRFLKKILTNDLSHIGSIYMEFSANQPLDSVRLVRSIPVNPHLQMHSESLHID